IKVDAEPSCVTRKALQPAGTPVGPITNDRPNRSVRMLGSPALLLPASSRFGLNVAADGSAVTRRVPSGSEVAAATELAPRDVLSDAMKRTTMTDERARALRALRGMRVPPANDRICSGTCVGLAALAVPEQVRARFAARRDSVNGR